MKYGSLSVDEQRLIPWFRDNLAALGECIRMNAEFMRSMALEMAPTWGVTNDPESWTSARHQDYDKVRHVMKQIVREWSDEGEKERATGFERVFDYLETEYPIFQERSKVRVLVPGAGLGRLNYELVARGFWCQGNEFSYHMLLASSYILNQAYSANEYSIFPFIHYGSNQRSRDLQTRPVYLPDVHPSAELDVLQQRHPFVNFGENMSIVAGSFTDLYGPEGASASDFHSKEPAAVEFCRQNKESMDCVVTHFFLDTASNVIDYLKTIDHCLKPGALWINFGPLLWHFEDEDDVHEITRGGRKVPVPVKGLELSLKDILVLSGKWFDLIHRESGITSGYASDIKAMGVWQYECEFWVMRKRG